MVFSSILPPNLLKYSFLLLTGFSHSKDLSLETYLIQTLS